MTERDDAISHILSSARYWLKNDDPDYLMCDTPEDAIYAAGYHVKNCHYHMLTVEDIKECRQTFGLSKMTDEEVIEYYDFL